MPVPLILNTNGVKKTAATNGYPRKPITEIVTNGFFSVDRKWTVKYWNKAAEELLGVKKKDILGKNLWEKFVGVLPIDFYMVYHKAFLQDIPVHFLEYWGEKGAWFDVITYHYDDTLSISFKSSNHPAELPEQTESAQSAELKQTSDLAQPEERLKILNELYRFVTEVTNDCHELYRFVTEVTNDCLWEWDLQTKEIFWIDGGHKRVFGYPIENALIPQDFWESLVHPEDKPGLLTRLNKVIKKRSSVWEDEYRFRKTNGDYAFVHDRGHIIYGEDNKALRMIGATQDITDKVLLQNKIAEERFTRQNEITSAVLTAQENERAHIGEELHDNLNQILAVAKLYIQMSKTYEKDREMYLEKSVEFIGNVIEEIRRISKTLVIPAVHITGLFDNINNLLHDLVKIHPVKIEFHQEGIAEEDLDEKLQLSIFRIVQEQLNNILKHAKAAHATIDLSRKEDQIILLISDDGDGCDILKENNGVGIININSRVELYSGKVTTISKPGKGYELKVVLPLNVLKSKPEISKAMPGV